MRTFTDFRKISDAADTLKNFAAVAGTELDAFGPKNLIYGYNGAGKTTISRIMSFIGSGKRPVGLSEHFGFEFGLAGGGKLTKTSDLSPFAKHVLVYNEDYIEKHFAWASGTAEPIFGLGEQNITDVEALQAARQQHAKLSADHAEAKKEAEGAKRRWDRFCTDTARTIEEGYIGKRGFTARTLKSRYEAADFDPTQTLSSDARAEMEQTFRQAAPSKLEAIGNRVLGLDGEVKSVFPVLARSGEQIKLPELEAHGKEMEAWVEEGHEYHTKHSLSHCLFCGQPLTKDRLQALLNHFSDEINQISSAATLLKTHLTDALGNISSGEDACPAVEQFAISLRADYEELREVRSQLADKIKGALGQYVRLLDRKLAEPATALSDAEAEAGVDDTITAINDYAAILAKQVDLIDRHNDIVERFDEEQKRARESIIQHLLADNYATFQEHEQASTAAERAVEVLKAAIAETDKDIEAKEASLREHAAATPELNKEVQSFLRHADITLHAVEEGYQLRRADGTVVSRLSEGEKTAITFCHFITSLEADNRKLKDTIVVIDDPISSLDTRALSYMGSLIRDRLQNVGQLFIFTHNAPFMSDMRKWIYPRSRMVKDWEEKKQTGKMPDIPLFHLNLRFDYETSRRWATLENMGALLRDYEGEYHYLYSLVYDYAKQPDPTSEHFLLLPNAIRKVMETYLLFKLPNNTNFGSAIGQMAANVLSKPKFNALRTFAEKEGHGEDLTAITQPAMQTIEEAHSAAHELMSLIRETDPTHAAQMQKICERR